MILKLHTIYVTRNSPGMRLVKIHAGDIPAALSNGTCFNKGNHTSGIRSLGGFATFMQIERQREENER